MASASGGPLARVGGISAAPLLPCAGTGASMPLAHADQAAQLGLRRVKGKQPPPDDWKDAMAKAAFSDEILHGTLGKMLLTNRSTHVHYTHGRSGGLGHTQPCLMTRQEFGEHLEACNREAYPDPTSPTGSILSFGIVAQERSFAEKNGFQIGRAHV